MNLQFQVTSTEDREGCSETTVTLLVIERHVKPPSMTFYHHLLLPVFLNDTAASQVLTRFRRANSFFEEVKQGDMERECVEERCSWEEAKEIFEDVDKTV